MLSYITNLKPPNEAIKFVYGGIEPTNEYSEIEYIKYGKDINQVSLSELVDGKSYISMPVSRHKKIGYVVPDCKGEDYELLGWLVISEYEAKKTLNQKNQRHLSNVDRGQIRSLLFDLLINTY